MKDFTFIKTKNDINLISDLKELVNKERQTLSEILHYLREISERKLYLIRGHTSLFAFLTDELQYSESAAQRRILAMRLIQDLPEVKEKIETGKISLSVASQIQTFIRKDFEKRKEEQTSPMSQGEKLDLLSKLEGSSARDCQQKLAQISPELMIPPEKERALAGDKTLLQFVADPKLMVKINRLKVLLSHQNPEGRLDQLFAKLVDLGLEKLDPERREARREKRSVPVEESFRPSLPTSAPAPKKSRRFIPQKIRDQVWLRDHGECQFRDPLTGKICGSRRHLQLDHKFPFALGGGHSLENLRLRCKSHNLFHSREIFGERIRASPRERG